MGRNTLLLGLLVILCTLSSAQVVINSMDYKDVASGVFYANVIGESNYYVYPSVNLQSAVLGVGPDQNIILIQSEGVPVHAGYKSALQANGGSITQEFISSDPFAFNLELADRSGAHSFIITDPDYSYNLVVLFPYAKASGSYVVYATKENAGQVASFLASHASTPTLVYGTVDSEVISALEAESIQFTQIENGDKYLDNVELVEDYFSKYDAQKQVTFADGTFFEPSITDGVFPVVLISNTIPSGVYDMLHKYIASGELSIGVLIKDDYTAAIYNLMKNLNAGFDEKKFSVFVKMGQTSGAQEEVQGLIVYSLPAIVLDVQLVNIQYNSAKEGIELILENTGTIATYVTSSMNIYSDGEIIGTVGDEGAQQIEKGETKGFFYPLIVENPGKLTANLTTYFSSSKFAYERALTAYMDLGVVDFIDSTSLEVLASTYSPDADAVSLKYSNAGEEKVYLRTSIEYVSDHASSTVDDPEVRMLEPGQTTVVRIGGLLIDPEEISSLEMEAVTEFGGREEFLVNTLDTPVEIMEPEAPEFDMSLILLIILAVIILALVIYFLTRKKGDKEPVALTAKKKK